MKIGRNAPCPCGSGRKYKSCCRNKSASMPVSQKLIAALLGLIVIGGLIIGIATMTGSEDHMGLSDGQGPGQGRVWSDEHQHWH